MNNLSFLEQSKSFIVIISNKKLAKIKKKLYYYLRSDFFVPTLKGRALSVFITFNK